MAWSVKRAGILQAGRVTWRRHAAKVVALAGAIAGLIAAQASLHAELEPAQPVATASPAAAGFNPQIAALLAPLMPPGTRIESVELGCDPPPDAVVQTVAPGIVQLQSRGFVVLFAAGARSIACTATVNAHRRVLAAVHDIAPGEPLAAADFQSQWVEAFAGAPGALADLPPGGLVAAGPLRTGQPLYPSLLTRPLMIHPGDLVTVRVTNGPVTVRTQLEARSAAALGETATVVNPASGQPVGVTVTGPKTAELVMP